MANSKSADKRARQNRSRYELKHAQRSIVRTSVKNVLSAVESKDKKVKDIFKDSQSKIDRLADKGVIHKNKAARLKSRLNSKLKS
ncbi:30S ribosomal protein S20 [Bacteroidota bacterium]|nr:30S ribosomal protein S20 [Gammaproteobacteria bacterium]MAO98803.1 30S ribosomal protein S20 [Gammaproteobacteria bacterium]MDA9715842.1 30S ribosomal protein S20 [Bacteroidota bacterium]MEC7859308.1 30S ribosomal protein S20 [Pseudomonadota bacterium]|tara:strand:- start:3154 stop:3408 length:255 start_codon:yes stop_codon:yes gene_type:complete